MESSLDLPMHPGGGISDLAIRNHAGHSLEDAAFLLLQGRHLVIRQEQEKGCSMMTISQELKIAPLTGHSPTVPDWGQGAESNRDQLSAAGRDRARCRTGDTLPAASA